MVMLGEMGGVQVSFLYDFHEVSAEKLQRGALVSKLSTHQWGGVRLAELISAGFCVKCVRCWLLQLLTHGQNILLMIIY